MADLPVHQKARHVNREELYTLVWQKPMSRLAEEFGIGGNGLAKICDRMDVPYPLRGYWAKKDAGKPVVVFKLLPRKDGIPQVTDIHPTPPKPAPLPEAERSATVAAAKVEAIARFLRASRMRAARRVKEIDDKRWNKLCEFAANWEQRDRLLVLLVEVEKRVFDEDDIIVGDSALSDWIAWAKERVEALDPLRRGAAGMFDTISKVSQWS